QQRSLRQKATSSDLSLQFVYIAARNNRSLPTILIAASNNMNTTTTVSHSIPLLPSSAIAVYIAAPSSSYCNRTLAATDATCSHEVTEQSQPTLLLPSSSSTIVATLICHPPLGDITPTAPTLLSFTIFNLKIAATLFSRFVRLVGDPYVMTSLDLFEAKLEAFEMRMDAKLYALFKEFRLG
ncbi:hypothetical protein BHE74_00034383, partial [Ensete ventricosum]